MDFFPLAFKYMIRVIDMMAYTYYSPCNMCLYHKAIAVASSHFGINEISLLIKRFFFLCFFFQNYSTLLMFPVLKIKIITPIYFYSDFLYDRIGNKKHNN